MSIFLYYLVFVLSITVTVTSYIVGFSVGIYCLVTLTDYDTPEPKWIKLGVGAIFLGSTTLALAITMGG